MLWPRGDPASQLGLQGDCYEDGKGAWRLETNSLLGGDYCLAEQYETKIRAFEPDTKYER